VILDLKQCAGCHVYVHELRGPVWNNVTQAHEWRCTPCLSPPLWTWSPQIVRPGLPPQALPYLDAADRIASTVRVIAPPTWSKYIDAVKAAAAAGRRLIRR
jgi:hypothetical protein